ncbi:MAG TPA: MBL fold metallo-hydrolase [Dokdonella sp.]|uniref:MBL fold metallo-hydrolase n=1 Tax=Dokdonella sp. TaxID=2291710 RepID=UPI002D80F3B3|nr:MBL fold metallo-hydrolase [Dokdonella sp.]HET9033917.1 MBL fold metallo-hydrolase [Dokdonella sp.]
MDFEHGITAIDTGFHRPAFDASHLLIERNRAAFIDVGTNYSIPALLAELDLKGVAREAVDYVIVTHVHLDHAGGAGEIIRQLPNAKLAVHPRGAPHMINPARLVASASSVYGAEEVKRTYGDLVPVPAERVVEIRDGAVIDLAGRPLRCLDTPGHARHHFSVWDERSRSFFPGDTFGLSYREFDTDKGAFILPTTTPVQFDPVALKGSIARMLLFKPDAMFLTHYSRVTDVERLGRDLFEQIDAMVAIAESSAGQAERHEFIKEKLAELYFERATAHGCRMTRERMAELLSSDIELNAQGLEIWLDHGRR